MRSFVSFVDEKLLATDFGTGDVVRKSGTRDFVLSPYAGRVLYSNTDTGKVQVQWPWGVELESPSELIRQAGEPITIPTSIDQSYSTWESERFKDGKEVEKADNKWRKSLASKVFDSYEQKTLPLYRAACEAWHLGMPEVETFVRMSSAFSADFSTDAIRLTVSNLYESGRRLAIYWKDKKRRYKTTQQEKDSKNLSCPRCKSFLRPRVYRQGRRLLNCKQCGFCIAPKDLILRRDHPICDQLPVISFESPPRSPPPIRNFPVNFHGMCIRGLLRSTLARRSSKNMSTRSSLC